MAMEKYVIVQSHDLKKKWCVHVHNQKNKVINFKCPKTGCGQSYTGICGKSSVVSSVKEKGIYLCIQLLFL